MAPGVADLYAAVRPWVVKITSASSSAGNAGTWSGVAIDTAGHIVTTFHVVDGFDSIDVKLADGTAVRATVVGTDPGDDLAVLKIDVPGRLAPVTIAERGALRVGDAMTAIGNPFGLEATLTEGVVSGIGRILASTSGRPLRQVIQTDTAINPGNAGGGLFNFKGELVGITNAIENPSGQDVFVGIGYAIPVSTLLDHLADMIAGKTVVHAKLGV